MNGRDNYNPRRRRSLFEDWYNNMSGQNRLVLSEATEDGKSAEELAKDLLNANAVAAEESGEKESEE